MEKDFQEGLEIELPEEVKKEAEELDKKSEPLFQLISGILGYGCYFGWEYAPGLFQALLMAPKGLKETFEQLSSLGMIFPVPGISHKKYGRLFIIATSPRESKKIQKKLFKLKHVFPKEWKTVKGELPLEDRSSGNNSNEESTH